jgi:hypothetical protein
MTMTIPFVQNKISSLSQYPEFQQRVDKEAPKTDQPKGKSKVDKEDRLIQNYISHLDFIINWGVYDDFLESKEIIKMAQIKSHMQVSKHPQITEVQALYNKVITIIRKHHLSNIEKWVIAINDEIADSKARNNQNALKCPLISWSDNGSDNRPKAPILRAIIAIRTLLEEKKFLLRNDVWKSYSVITDEKGIEQYQSVQTDSLLREWRNYIYERKANMYSMDVLKDAYHQIAKDNQYHSLQEKIRAVEWDGVDRYGSGAQAFGLKLTGDGEDVNFTSRVFKQHLMASMARVFHPGVWYDLVLCTFGAQGAGKTTGLRILYGRDNIISCNFFELDPKKQSEATRNGIAAVENADTFGDARKADFNRIKADVSTDSWVGRDAYGRMEDVRRVNISYVIWYTGNELKVLRDPTGNRRFIIVYSERAIDEDWLRLNSWQLWAQAYKDMEALRGEYLENMRRKGIAEEYPKYLELPHDLWAEAERRQNASMVDGGAWEDWLPEIILQNFVIWPLIVKSVSGERTVNGKKSIHVLTRDILNYLHEDYQKLHISDQALSLAMSKVVVLAKERCQGLGEDIKWRKAQIKRNNGNLRGYRIDFDGEAKEKAFWILERMSVEGSKSAEENFDENVIDLLSNNRSF